jgi:D-glycero-alpha-D-manno-heptose-7-phosphate kinase
MIAESIALSEILAKKPVLASAPHRIDIGGTWDLKPFAMLYRQERPCTLNIAISLRTTVELRAYKEGYIHIADDAGAEEYNCQDWHFNDRFGLITSLIKYLGVDGFAIKLSYDAPNRSGLGGSGVVAVAVLAAINAILPEAGVTAFARAEMALITHAVEDGLRYSHTGLQDQCAALFGGINLWEWDYDVLNLHFSRLPIDSQELIDALSDRLVIAYIGVPHYSSSVNEVQVEGLLNGRFREQWLRINDLTRAAFSSLENADWSALVAIINGETALRSEIAPSRITPLGEVLQGLAHGYESSFAAAGAGNGGCVWSLCPTPEAADSLKAQWSQTMASIPDAHILEMTVDQEGLVVSESSHDL